MKSELEKQKLLNVITDNVFNVIMDGRTKEPAEVASRAPNMKSIWKYLKSAHLKRCYLSSQCFENWSDIKLFLSSFRASHAIL